MNDRREERDRMKNVAKCGKFMKYKNPLREYYVVKIR